MLRAVKLGIVSSPMVVKCCLNLSLSSVKITDSIGEPRIWILYFSKIPSLYSWTPQLRAVWPPNDSVTQSGLSNLITFRIS